MSDKYDGSRCPVCYSEFVADVADDFGAAEIIVKMACDDCGARWKDIYTLSHFTEVERGEDDNNERN